MALCEGLELIESVSALLMIRLHERVGNEEGFNLSDATTSEALRKIQISSRKLNPEIQELLTTPQDLKTAKYHFSQIQAIHSSQDGDLSLLTVVTLMLTALQDVGSSLV